MDEQPKNLTALAHAYPPPTRGLRAFVLREFHQIQGARRKGWTWPEIAAVLERPVPSRSLATAFARVERRVKEGTLEAPDAAPATAARPKTSTSTGAISAPTAGGDDSKPSQPSTIKRLTL
jgi:hypothetical protein